MFRIEQDRYWYDARPCPVIYGPGRSQIVQTVSTHVFAEFPKSIINFASCPKANPFMAVIWRNIWTSRRPCPNSIPVLKYAQIQIHTHLCYLWRTCPFRCGEQQTIKPSVKQSHDANDPFGQRINKYQHVKRCMLLKVEGMRMKHF